MRRCMETVNRGHSVSRDVFLTVEVGRRKCHRSRLASQTGSISWKSPQSPRRKKWQLIVAQTYMIVNTSAKQNTFELIVIALKFSAVELRAEDLVVRSVISSTWRQRLTSGELDVLAPY